MRTGFFCELIRLISTVLSKIKNGDPINFDQISARVTTKVEKSNFYKDLEGVIDIDFKQINRKNKTTLSLNGKYLIGLSTIVSFIWGWGLCSY